MNQDHYKRQDTNTLIWQFKMFLSTQITLWEIHKRQINRDDIHTDDIEIDDIEIQSYRDTEI